MNQASKDLAELRLFYDGSCPICMMEIRHLDKLDRNHALDLQDINAGDFNERFPHIDAAEADRLLHAELPDGSMLYGLDASCRAWDVVGKGHWFAFLRWPLIRPVADLSYRGFARYRHRLGRFFGRTASCDSGSCPAPGKNTSKHR